MKGSAVALPDEVVIVGDFNSDHVLLHALGILEMRCCRWSPVFARASHALVCKGWTTVQTPARASCDAATAPAVAWRDHRSHALTAQRHPQLAATPVTGGARLGGRPGLAAVPAGDLPAMASAPSSDEVKLNAGQLMPARVPVHTLPPAPS